MSGRFRCASCERVLFDPNPKNVSGAERAKLARASKALEQHGATTDASAPLVDEYLDALNANTRPRPQGEAETTTARLEWPETGLPFQDDALAVLVLWCRRCRRRWRVKYRDVDIIAAKGDVFLR